MENDFHESMVVKVVVLVFGGSKTDVSVGTR
jgi:hypothetical protein